MSVGMHSVKVLSTTFGYSLDATVTGLCHHLTYDLWEAWHKVYAMLLSNISEMLPEIHKMEKFEFLKCIINFQII